MSDFLTSILAHKYDEVAVMERAESLADLQSKVLDSLPPLDFRLSLEERKLGRVALIAEIKKASPSKGLLVPHGFDPAGLAKAYNEAGVAALSVLTDEKFFQGHLSYIQQAKTAAGGRLPILRKDFIVAPYQVWQARAYGADAILLIMATLEDGQAAELFDLAAEELSMAVLVEVHNENELHRALELGATIIGINNRDLHSFNVDLDTTARLAAQLPENFGGLLVSESGLATSEDIERVAEAGANVVLIGETLVKAASRDNGLDLTQIGLKTRELFGLAG